MTEDKNTVSFFLSCSIILVIPPFHIQGYNRFRILPLS